MSKLFSWVRPGSPLSKMPSFWDGVVSVADPWGEAFADLIPNARKQGVSVPRVLPPARKELNEASAEAQKT